MYVIGSKCLFVSIAIFTLLILQRASGLNQQYFGCYVDKEVNRALSGLGQNSTGYDQTYLTLETCLAYCSFNTTWTYFGAQDYTQCFCGDDDFTRYGLANNEDSCWYPCPGNNNQKCGGNHFISVYAVCERNLYGAQCNSSCYCNGGTTCIRSNGTCLNGCRVGWNGPTCFTDINECNQTNGGCNQSCMNSPGSFSCGCYTGYYNYGSDGKNCTDIDECKLNNGGCNQICNNTPGSFNCSCHAGYKLYVDGKNCTDINECLQNNGGCNQTCNNTVGSFYCTCPPPGLILALDNKTCNDTNECSQNNGGCSDNCTNTYGSFYCSCLQGYNITKDGKNCSDINECDQNNGGCSQNCTNTNGSFFCSCLQGYNSTNDGKSCSDVSAPSPSSSDNKVLTIVLAVILPIVLCVAIAVAIACYLRRKRAPKSDDKKLVEAAPSPVFEEDGYATKSTKATLTRSSRQSIFPGNINPVDAQSPSHYENVMMPMETSRLKVIELAAYHLGIKNNSVNLAAEYEAIEKVSEREKFDFGNSSALKKKNRFKNIVPYDKNRVKLTEVNDNPLSSYVNASFIQGYCREKKIIAAQGPTKESLSDFWKMIWEQNISTIFMLTLLTEKGKKKCEMYWSEEGQVQFDDITVKMLTSTESTDHTICTLLVTKNEIERTIMHLQFTDWPDHGVPNEALPILCFMQKAKKYIDPDKFTLYHCSAGVGRTGTFLAIDFLLSEAAETGEVDVSKCVKDMREQRMHSVQSFSQYMFIFQALSEGVTVGKSRISATNIAQRCSALSDVSPISGKTVLETEFDILFGEVTSQPVYSSSKGETSDIFTTSSAVKIKQVFLKTKPKGKSGFVNAAYVQAFERRDGYIVTQLPLMGSAEEFWNMCIDYNCRTVLLLPTEIELLDDKSLVPPQGSSKSHGQVHIRHESEEMSKQIEACNICRITVTKDNALKSDAVYENAAAKKDNVLVVIASVPESTESVGERLVAIHHVMKLLHSENLTQGPVVVIGRNSIALCGQYIAVSHINEMINVHDQVDVIQAVLEVKKSLPHFLAYPREYEELYRAANMCSKRRSQPIYTNIL